MRYFLFRSLSFFFNDTAPTEIYTLSLHDALPVVIGIKLSVAAARPRPVQIEAVEAVNLFCLGASMDLHRGLLVAVVAGYIEGARCYPGHLRGGGPRVAPARNVLQQGLVKRR